MPITEDIYSVFVDGRPLARGLRKDEAYRQAEAWAREQNRKNASDKRRNPEWEVKIDRSLVQEDDAMYKWAKHGG